MIVWRPLARADLLSLYDWIADQAGEAVAFAYVSKLEALTLQLIDFPSSGAPRDDFAPGVRTLNYRGRTVLAYRLVGDAVEVLRVAHKGRDLGLMFDAD